VSVRGRRAVDFAASGRSASSARIQLIRVRKERSIFSATVLRQIVMVVVRFVKWSGPDTAVNPGQTPSTGYMRMLVFRN